MSQVININDQGEVVSIYQGNLNDRLLAHGSQPIDADGICGPMTISQSAFAAWFLGAQDATVQTIQGGSIPIGVQKIVADPSTRVAAQRQRAVDRRGQTFPGGTGSADDVKIILCSEWGAVAPTQPITRAGKPNKIIFHHTEGHHAEIDHQPGDSLEEAMAFARAIQQDHMRRPYIDSGHNFLVTRSGHILEGRHESVAAIMAGVMVVSAHCVGQNDQPGIEHEHLGPESMTDLQRQASLSLHALICRKTGIAASAVHGHGEFNNTDCPGVLKAVLPSFRTDLAARLGQ